ncbi:thiamine-phosphate pyrophosphorylase [Gracilibacillus halotolerans]|uniref:Thiamine-phosphate synthase n=1 Tax=Gracilibacillus halotolerans TaxID=74386 RepID=A0A841RKZ1_9BACI|nr:thiamine phosphate synthase [Gracilibacillus halotolerans]MBB6513149.1 thiamine-phosphate pyrophosphorylase [Gracilibacillus halotolerans]
MDKSWLRLYFILGSNNVPEDTNVLSVLEDALKGGITLFQFREKGIGARQGLEKVELAKQMQALCQQYNVPFLVNDDIDLALEIGADGVHVGQDDKPIEEIRAICPKNWIIGVSATNTDQAVTAKENGADYIGVGPIYATKTKEDAKKPIGTEGLQAIREAVGNLPIVTIGGIRLGHVFDLIHSGADGVSVISSISKAENPERMARVFSEHLQFSVR